MEHVCKKCNSKENFNSYVADGPDRSEVIRTPFGRYTVAQLSLRFKFKKLSNEAMICKSCNTISTLCPHCDSANIFYDHRQFRKCDSCGKEYLTYMPKV